MFNYLANIYNGTGDNFVDIFVNKCRAISRKLNISFRKAQNIAGFELPQRFRFSERLGSAFWRLSHLIGRAYFVIA